MFKNVLFRRLLKGFAAIVLLYFVVIFVYGWASDWKPQEEMPLTPTQNSTQQVLTDSVLHFVTWNVGYGGLGAQSDFFYDDEGMWYSGSSMIHAPREQAETYLKGAKDFLQQQTADFYLLQEVDTESDRSNHLNLYENYSQALPGFAATFAPNYRCKRVPIPLLEPWHPYGQVESGLATYSRAQPAESVRYQLPGEYPMPDRMFQLDRCIAVQRYPTSTGKTLVVINLHNSAYDPGDKIKAIQLPYLRDLALREYSAGNYVVLGGDWNQCPPNFRFDQFMRGNTQGYTQGNVPLDFFPDDWRFAYDPTISTNRKARDPYKKGETFETLIDFFLVSPNVRVRAVKGIQQDFQFSDHQPVWMEVELQ